MRRLMLALLGVALSGCAALQPAGSALSPDLPLDWPPDWPLPPATAGYQLNATQLLTLRRDEPGGDALVEASEQDSPQQILVELALTAERLSLVALTPWGQHLLSLTLTADGALEVQRSGLLPAILPPAAIVRDLQLVHWPAPVLHASLAGSSWQLAAQAPQRTLLRDGEPWILVRYADGEPWQGAVELRHLHYHYRMRIDTLEVTWR